MWRLIKWLFGEIGPYVLGSLIGIGFTVVLFTFLTSHKGTGSLTAELSSFLGESGKETVAVPDTKGKASVVKPAAPLTGFTGVSGTSRLPGTTGEKEASPLVALAVPAKDHPVEMKTVDLKPSDPKSMVSLDAGVRDLSKSAIPMARSTGSETPFNRLPPAPPPVAGHVGTDGATGTPHQGDAIPPSVMANPGSPQMTPQMTPQMMGSSQQMVPQQMVPQQMAPQQMAPQMAGLPQQMAHQQMAPQMMGLPPQQMVPPQMIGSPQQVPAPASVQGCSPPKDQNAYAMSQFYACFWRQTCLNRMATANQMIEQGKARCLNAGANAQVCLNYYQSMEDRYRPEVCNQWQGPGVGP